MRTHQYAQKKRASQSSCTSVPRPSEVQSSVQHQPIQAKSNEEGLAEHAERLRKFQRLGNPFLDKGPPRFDNDMSNPLQPKPWIQRKMTLGQPGDKYEQEADRVASQVVRQINAPSLSQFNQGRAFQHQPATTENLQKRKSSSELQRLVCLQGGQCKGQPAVDILKLQERKDKFIGEEISTDLDSVSKSAMRSVQAQNLIKCQHLKGQNKEVHISEEVQQANIVGEKFYQPLERVKPTKIQRTIKITKDRNNYSGDVDQDDKNIKSLTYLLKERLIGSTQWKKSFGDKDPDLEEVKKILKKYDENNKEFTKLEQLIRSLSSDLKKGDKKEIKKLVEDKFYGVNKEELTVCEVKEYIQLQDDEKTKKISRILVEILSDELLTKSRDEETIPNKILKPKVKKYMNWKKSKDEEENSGLPEDLSDEYLYLDVDNKDVKKILKEKLDDLYEKLPKTLILFLNIIPEQKEVRYMKTQLVEALVGTDWDKLKESAQEGITTMILSKCNTMGGIKGTIGEVKATKYATTKVEKNKKVNVGKDKGPRGWEPTTEKEMKWPSKWDVDVSYTDQESKRVYIEAKYDTITFLNKFGKDSKQAQRYKILSERPKESGKEREEPVSLVAFISSNYGWMRLFLETKEANKARKTLEQGGWKLVIDNEEVEPDELMHIAMNVDHMLGFYGTENGKKKYDLDKKKEIELADELSKTHTIKDSWGYEYF